MAPDHDSALERAGPYVGLDYFAEDKAALFFGRDAERRMIIANLRASRLTLLYAESGVGKSSLLRAGVAARLEELAHRSSAEHGSPRYFPVVFNTWRDDPVAALINRIEATARPFVGNGSDLALGADGLDQAIERLAGALDATPLVMLDQFEDYFLYHGETDAGERFADGLARCVGRADLHANFLISIREDAYSRIGDVLKARVPNVYGNYLHLDYLNRRAARDAIVQPIEQVNRSLVEDAGRFAAEPALVEEVLDQVRRGRVAIGDGGRPDRDGGDGGGAAERFETAFLQLVMERLWNEETAAESRVLRLETLRRLGGAETIIRTHVDGAMSELDADQRDAAAAAFRFLVTSGGRKIALTARELSEFSERPEPTIAPALRHLEGKRILRAAATEPTDGSHDSGDEGANRWELFHDILAAAVVDWRRRHVDEQRRRETVRELEQQRARARRERQRARRFRAIAIGAVLFAVASAVLGVVFWREKQLSDSREAVARSAAALARDPAQSVRFALDALEARETRQAQEALRTAYPDFLVQRILRGHGDVVLTATLSPHGRYAASGSEDKTIRIWDTRAGELFRPPLGGHGDSIWYVDFSPDGRYLVSAGNDGSARVWDWQNRSKSTPEAILRHSRYPVYSARFSPDGRYVATAGQGREVRVWDWRKDDRRPRYVFRDPNASYMADAAISKDGRVIAAGNDTDVGYYALLLWRLGGTHEPQSYEWHNEPINSVAFGPGRWAVTGSGDKSAAIWDLDDPKGGDVPPLVGHTDQINAAAFTPDGDRVLTASDDGTVRFWDWRNQALLITLRGHTDPVSDAQFSADGTRVVTASADGSARVWDATSSDSTVLPHEWNRDQFLMSVDFDDTGKFLVTAGQHSAWLVWDATSGRRVKYRRTPNPSAWLNDASFSPDGKRIVTAGTDNLALIWDRRRRTPPIRLKGHTSEVNTAAFSADGRTIATASDDHRAAIWDADRRSAPRFLEGHEDVVLAAAFTPGDDRKVVTASQDGTAKIWDARTGELLHTLRGHRGIVHDAAFSPDGTETLTAGSDSTARVWDTNTGQQIRTLEGSIAPLLSAQYDPDGKRIITTGSDGATRIWDAATGAPVTVLKMHSDSVNDADISPDGKLIASASDDSTAKIYPCRTCLPHDELVRRAEARLEALNVGP